MASVTSRPFASMRLCISPDGANGPARRRHLKIKERRLADPGKRAAVRSQLAALRKACGESVAGRAGLPELVAGLRAVNAALWEAEDGLRACERRGDFGPRFVALARSVYLRNDERSALKQRVNDLLGSGLGEPKAYGPGG
jgi:hypothetical protein